MHMCIYIYIYIYTDVASVDGWLAKFNSGGRVYLAIQLQQGVGFSGSKRAFSHSTDRYIMPRVSRLTTHAIRCKSE